MTKVWGECIDKKVTPSRRTQPSFRIYSWHWATKIWQVTWRKATDHLKCKQTHFDWLHSGTRSQCRW